MIHGTEAAGTIGRIEFAEFFQVGQPKILGRYPIHFHMTGAMFNSYIIGNAVHDSYARTTTLHGVHYLRVQKNVAYNVQGHNFFVEDGIETYNVIEYNLAVQTK